MAPVCEKCETSHWNFQPCAHVGEKKVTPPGGLQPWGKPWHNNDTFGPPTNH